MSWRDQYQKGSFRGVPFRTERHERSGGRRQVVHEFPGRDEPMLEDLGRKARTFNVEFHVVGSGYFSDRDALIDALESAGPGLLVHPWHGSMQVGVIDYSVSEDTEEGGIARFSVVFTEAGVPVEASQSTDAQSLSLASASKMLANAPATFAKVFSVKGWPSFVEKSASGLISKLAGVTSVTASILGGAGSALRTFEKGLATISTAGLLHSPLALGQAVSGMISSVGNMSGTTRKTIAVFKDLISYDPVLQLNRSTPARSREADNAASMLHLFRISSSAELVRTIANSTFSSQDEAVAVRNAVSGLLDTAMTVAADAGADEYNRQFRELRNAVVRDIGQRAPRLPSVYEYAPRATEPAIVIASRLYGHEQAVKMAEEMAARNNSRHPGFMAGATALKVVTNG